MTNASHSDYLISKNMQTVLDTYWSTLLRAVDGGNFHGVEAGVRISVMQAVDGVAQIFLKILNKRLAWTQDCYPLEKTHLCPLYTHTHTHITTGSTDIL